MNYKYLRRFLLPLAVLMVLLTFLLPSRTQIFAQGTEDRWAGVISDEDGLPLAASITINGVQGHASADGSFELYVPRASDDRYVIHAELFGYVPVSQIHIGTAIEALNLTLKQAQQFEIDPSQQASVEDGRGTQILIPANSLVDANGNPATGSLQLLLYTYDLTQEAMPGDMGALDSQGQPVALESAGVFYAQFTDAQGNEYNLAPNAQAEISIPVDQSAQWPSIIPLWSYDESEGLWKEEGQATQAAGRYTGQVSHFSYWNFDVKWSAPACIKLTVDPVFLALNSPIEVKAVLKSPNRVRNLSLTQTTNVLINLPANAKVNFYMPPSSPTPFASVNTGAPWGGTGIPPHPYDDCNGTLDINGQETGAIHGMKWNDLDGDGEKESNEPGLEDWTISLTDATGNTFTTTTNAEGNYWFMPLAAGTYTVSEVMQDGWTQTFPTAPGTHTVTLQAGQAIEALDFGNESKGPAMCSCQIDLANNSHTCDDIPAISFVNGPSNNRVVVKINLDPNAYGYTQALFDVEYGSQPQGWTVNIGDSQSNNGYAGDASHQSNDAEMQILNDDMAVYASDNGGSGQLLSKLNLVTQGTIMSLKVLNEELRWNNHNGEAGQLSSAGLYALSGQSDAQGPTNYDIYAGFNRTIGSTSRNGSGVSKVDINLCAKVGAIHGMKWHDLDGDGEKDANEPGLPDWEISLTDASGNVLTTTTDAQGNYWFMPLATGTYTVSEVMQNGWTQTFPTAPGTHTVDLEAGQAVENIDFGNTQPSQIHGMKWNDLDGDGEKDPNEPGLPDWEITLTDASGNVLTTTTDAEGNYWFMGLTPGTYSVSEVQQDGWTQTFPTNPNRHRIQLSKGQVLEGIDFGNWRAESGQIHGMKWHDLDGDGEKDPGEQGLSGWTILLEDADGNVISTVTDADGNYWFMDLPPGTYTVAESLQQWWAQTHPVSGTHTVTLAAGQVVEGIEFGNWRYSDEYCAIGWDVHLNPNWDYVEIYLSIRNRSANAHQYDVELMGLPGLGELTNFTLTPSPPISIPAGSSRSVKVRIDPLPNLNSSSGPYQAIITNQDTGYSFGCSGQIWAANNNFWLDAEGGGIQRRLTFGEAQTMNFPIQNLSGQNMNVRFEIEAMVEQAPNGNRSSIGDGLISLNGKPAGEKITGTISVPAGEVGMISSEVELTQDVSDFHGDLILSVDYDNDGNIDAATSIMIGSVGPIKPSPGEVLYLPFLSR